MSNREDDHMDNGGTSDGDDRSQSHRDSEQDGSHHSANGHSPRPAGCSRSRSRSNSRRHSRLSRSRSNSKGRSRKYSRHSPDDRRHSSKQNRSRSPLSSRRRHVGNRENPPAGRCLGIFGLSIYTEERNLRDVFSKYGPLDNVQIVYDAQTGRSRGFAFVYFENKNHAAEAKDCCNGIEIDGRKIRVDFSITQRAHTPTPGIYMGKPSHHRNRSRSGRYGDRSYGDRRRSPSYFRDRRGGRYSRSRSRSFSPRKLSFSKNTSQNYSGYAY